MVSAVTPPIMTRNVGLKGFQPLAIDRRMRPMKLNGGPASHGSTQPMRPTSWSSAPRMIRTIIFSARQIIPQSANGGLKKDTVSSLGILIARPCLWRERRTGISRRPKRRSQIDPLSAAHVEDPASLIGLFSRGKESNSRQVFALNLLLNLYNIQYNASASHIRKLLRNQIAKTS